MKKISILIFALVSFTSINAQNAVKKVIIEPYYISDDKDATDTTGSFLEAGSKTYRIYIQLEPGCQLTKIYGDDRHALKISSTAIFFNNTDYGKTFGKDFNKVNYKKNTVALDTWLTLAQTTKKSVNTYFGILKSQDTDSSFIGGINNDGGSSEIPGGLLKNSDPLTGIPLTTADGMDTLVNVPTSWSDNGFIDQVSGVDSTIFGSVKPGYEFISNSAYIQNSGVSGVIPDSNQVLVAQLSTKGDISFELNIEVKELNGSIFKYVAVGIDTLDERVSPSLKYPPLCGCKDPNYLEYSSTYLCNETGSCKTPIVFGCMDPNACNYNPNANYNIGSMCCYPGMCSDRDISLVCPDLKNKEIKMVISPNPASDNLRIDISNITSEEVKLSICNMFGTMFLNDRITENSSDIKRVVNISALASGIYYVHIISNDGAIYTQMFIKN